VPQVVGGELLLVAADPPLKLRKYHDPGIVDQNVQRASPVVGERGHRFQVRHVHPGDVDGIVAGLDAQVGCDLPSCVGTPDREGDLGAGGRQCAGGLHPDAGGSAGDDGAPAGEVDAVDHFGGGRVAVERAVEKGSHGTFLGRDAGGSAAGWAGDRCGRAYRWRNGRGSVS
jgi:hypothetical protein